MQNNILRAAVWMIGSVVSFTSMALAGRVVSGALDTFEIMFYRSVIGILLVLAAGSLSGTLGQINTKKFGTHLVRNSCHFVGQNLWFFAITVAPLAQVFALEFTMPLWAMVLAVFVLGERLTGFRILMALIGFCGILIITQPWISGIGPGIAPAAAAAVCFAGSAVFTRLLTRTAGIVCIMFWLTTMQAVLGLVTAGYDFDIAVPPVALWPFMLLIGAAGLIAHYCLTKALTLAPATIVTPIDFARLPLVAVLGLLLYGEALQPSVLIGAAVIFGANYVNIWTESRRRETLPPQAMTET